MTPPPHFFATLALALCCAIAIRTQAQPAIDPAELARVEKILERIIATASKDSSPAAQAYTATIPNTTVSYTMMPIPAGTFTIGSPRREKGRKNDEGPQAQVSLDAFWMGKTEVTWNEYEIFMFLRDEKPGADAVTHPTKPYVEMSFGMGRDGYPAISMTQHAANKYCQWLSTRTGHFYRLPTDAEWEYAARAGTTTAYSFGKDARKLHDYATFNAEKYQKVATHKPNAWGLYDMHGNAMEWTLDQYLPNAYARLTGNPTASPWVKATRAYPHVVRGGSWADPPELLRSAARRGSEPDWKMLDPQVPKSVWYHTNAPWIGFRIVRPLAIPSAEEMYRYWNSGVERG